MVGIKAPLILDSDDCKLFSTWQKQHSYLSSGAGSIDTATKYLDFLHYLRGVKGESTPSIASSSASGAFKTAATCKHPLHPIDPAFFTHCPVCRVEACLKLLEVIMRKWTEHGGPWSHARALVNDKGKQKGYKALRTAWRKVRLELANMIEGFHVMVAKQENWDREHSDINVKGTYSYTKAIELAISATENPIQSEVPKYKEFHPRSKFSVDRLKKEVSFADGTNFSPSRDENCFDRSADEYSPGRHVAPSGSDYIDTSFSADTLWHIGQFILFSTNIKEKFDSWDRKPGLLHGEKCAGAVQDHALCDNILGAFKDTLEEREEGSEEKESLLTYWGEADTVIVLEGEKGDLLEAIVLSAVEYEHSHHT